MKFDRSRHTAGARGRPGAKVPDPHPHQAGGRCGNFHKAHFESRRAAARPGTPRYEARILVLKGERRHVHGPAANGRSDRDVHFSCPPTKFTSCATPPTDLRVHLPDPAPCNSANEPAVLPNPRCERESRGVLSRPGTYTISGFQGGRWMTPRDPFRTTAQRHPRGPDRQEVLTKSHQRAAGRYRPAATARNGRLPLGHDDKEAPDVLRAATSTARTAWLAPPLVSRTSSFPRRPPTSWSPRTPHPQAARTAVPPSPTPDVQLNADLYSLWDTVDAVHER